jgi:hypothetical protein
MGPYFRLTFWGFAKKRGGFTTKKADADRKRAVTLFPSGKKVKV